MNNGIKYVIIILNYVIRTAVILIITMVGCDTESDQLIYITNMVFICTFFNTGILPMLCTANLEGQLPPFITNALSLKGDSSDFNQNWFVNIGDTIVGSMMFNIYYPAVMEAGWFGLRTLKRLLDKRGASAEHPSKSQSIQSYVNIWCGPKFFIHYKYSSILNIVFITMVFGPGMPTLFQFACAQLVVLYTMENYMLYYVYKAPPSYDVKLNNHVLRVLAWAPFVMLIFAYWTFSNPQLLGSYESLLPLTTKSGSFYNQHYWFTSLRLV